MANSAVLVAIRIYNPSIARFLSVDPLTKSYPMLTPYQFVSNRPIDGVDVDGLEFMKRTSMLLYKGNPKIKQITTNDVIITNMNAFNQATYKSPFELQSTNPYNDISSKYNLSKESIAKMNELGNKNIDAKMWTEERLKYNRMASVRAANNSSKAGLEALLTEVISAYELYRTIQHNKENRYEINWATESVYADVNAHNLMNKVLADNILPSSVSNNKAGVEAITRYLIDGSGDNPDISDKFAVMVKAVGKAIWANRKSILSGTYNMNKQVLKPNCNGCDGSSDHPIYAPMFLLGAIDNDTKVANDAIKNYETSPKEGDSIRQN